MDEIDVSGYTEPSESQLYEDLCLFIKILKRIVNSMDAIVTLLLKSQDCFNLVTKLRETLTQHNKLISRYNYTLDQRSQYCNTYHRFICRLLENITPYKNRINLANPTVAIFGKFLTSAEQCVVSFQTQKNIGKIFKQIFGLVHSFCQSFDSVENDWFSRTVDEPTIRRKDRKRYQTQVSHQYSDEDSLIGRMRIVSSESNFHRVMVGLNRQFATVSCLDISYSDYKEMFFMCHTQRDELYQQMYGRNYFILQQIANYSKQFQEYIKRRNRPIVSRRSRIKDRQFKGRSVQQNYTTEKSTTTGLKNTIDTTQMNASLHHNFNLVDGTVDGRQKRLERQDKSSSKDTQMRKTKYQLKNVFLTIDKIYSNNLSRQKHQVVYVAPTSSNNYREKFKNQAILKINKNYLRGTKFAQHAELMSRPILEIKQYDLKSIKLKSQQSATIDSTLYQEAGQVMLEHFSKHTKHKNHRKADSEKKTMRVTQVPNKIIKWSHTLNDSCVQPELEEVEAKTFKYDGQPISRK